MSDQFIGEIRFFGFNFPPTGWAVCNGQLLPISQNPALFSILGTTYGGNGTTTFALPDLRGLAPLQQGQGPGLSNRTLGEKGGEQAVALIQSQMPAHSHGVRAATPGGQSSPVNNAWASGLKTGPDLYSPSSDNNVSMSPSAMSPAGGTSGVTVPHNNLMPYLCMNFCIALEGIFPQRS